MSESLQGESPAADDARLLNHEQDAGSPQSPNNQDDGTTEQGDGDGGEERRRNRPGRMERKLERTQADLQAARSEADAARRYAEDLRRRLAEANEAGNRLASNNLQGAIDAASREMHEAINAGDAAAVVTAQRKVSELAAANAVMRYAPQQQQPLPPQQEQAPTYTPTTSAWLRANKWFENDTGLRTLAKSIHAQAEAQGIAVDTPDYWKFIEDGVEAIVPGTVRKPGRAQADEDDDDPPPPRRNAPLPNRGNGEPSRAQHRAPGAPKGDINLTAEEADAAKVTGMTPQEFRVWQTRLVQQGRITKPGAR